MIFYAGISISVYGGVLMPIMIRAMQCSGDIHPELAKDANK